MRFAGSTKVGKTAALIYAGEYARQSEYADGPSLLEADYAVLELAVQVETIIAKLGWELLGGDGIYAFQVQFGTLHIFNGWADRFLETPADGLRDLYLDLSGTVVGFKLQGVFHDFQRDVGGARYGRELDLLLVRTFKNKRYALGAKFADYRAAEDALDPMMPRPFERSARKLWLWASLTLGKRN